MGNKIPVYCINAAVNFIAFISSKFISKSDKQQMHFSLGCIQLIRYFKLFNVHFMPLFLLVRLISPLKIMPEQKGINNRKGFQNSLKNWKKDEWRMVINAMPAATAAQILMRATVFALTIAVRQPLEALKHANAKHCKAPVLAPAAAREFRSDAKAYLHDWPSANPAPELQLHSMKEEGPTFH